MALLWQYLDTKLVLRDLHRRSSLAEARKRRDAPFRSLPLTRSTMTDKASNTDSTYFKLVDGKPDENAQELTFVETTSLTGCAFRALDPDISGIPLFLDPLAGHLAGPRGMEIGKMVMLKGPTEAGRPGGNCYWVARAFLLDKDILEQLATLRKRFPDTQRFQVVNMGCGMDTRPWRLPMPGVAWFDIDQPNVIHHKTTSLAAAGAQTTVTAPTTTTTHETTSNPGNGPSPGAQEEDLDGAAKASAAGSVGGVPFAFPLTCDEYYTIKHQFSATQPGGSLREALMRPGSQFDPTLPTLWCMEGLSYYLDMPTLSMILKNMAALSPTGSAGVITTCTKVCTELWQFRIQARIAEGNPPKGTITFSTSLDDFVTGGGLSPGSPNLLHDLGWNVDTLTPEYKEYLTQVAPDHFAYCAYPKDTGSGFPHDIETMPVEHTVIITHQ